MDAYLPFLDVFCFRSISDLVLKCNVTLSSASVYLSSVYAASQGISCNSRQYDSWQRVE